MHTKFNLPAILLILLAVSVPSESFCQSFEWVKQIGSTAWDEGKSVAVDRQGNIYTIGNFKGTVDFDPGQGVINLTSVGEEDAFICKLDTAGNLVWAKQYGDSAFVESNDLAIDSLGNIYTTGSFLGQVDFNPGQDVFHLTSSTLDRDVFIQKLDSSGDFIWAKQFSGITPTPTSTPSPVNAYAIAVNDMGQLYLSGYFDGTVDFDPDTASTQILNVVQASDIYICKLDGNGSLIWVKQYGGSQGAVAYAITLDDNSNVYTSGTIGGTYDFDPGPGVYNLSPSDPWFSEFFVSKLDSSGNFVWATALGPGDGHAVAVDDNENVYASAWYPNANAPVLNKLDVFGDTVWTKALVGAFCGSIALDESGNVYHSGICTGTNDFDPGAAVFNLSGEGAYIRKLDTAGNFKWAGIFTALTSQVNIKAMAIDEHDNVYTTGFFDGMVDFDPGTPVQPLTTPPGSYNIFVHKLAGSGLSTGISNHNFEGEMRLYPNPTAGHLTLEFGKTYDRLELTLRNSLGQILDHRNLQDCRKAGMQLEGAVGVYFLEILDAERRQVVRVLKK